MKKISILVTYLLFYLPVGQANLKKLSDEFLKNNFEIYKLRTQNDVASLGYDLEDAKYSWNLSAESSYRDSKLKTLNSFSISTIESKIQTLTLSKGFDWGGSLSFSNSLEQHVYKGDKAGFTQSLNYSQDLGRNFFGQQDKYSLEIAQSNIGVAKHTVDANSESKLYGFAALYIRASLLKSLLDYQAQAYQRALKRMNLIKRRVRDGLREQVDLYQANNSLLQSEEELITAENNFKDALEKLSESLHRKVDKSEVEYLSYEEMEMSLVNLEGNHNLKVLTEKLKLIEKELQKTKNDLFPALSLSVGYKTNNYDTELSNALSEGNLSGNNNELTAALKLSWNIGHESEKALSSLKKIEEMTIVKEIETQKKNLAVLSEVMKNKANNLNDIISSSRKRINLAQKTLDEYNSLYNKGRVDLDTVIRAEESLINTQRSYISHVSSHKELVYSLSLLYGDLTNYIKR